LDDLKLEFLSQGLAHKLTFNLIQKKQGTAQTFIGTGTLRLGVKTSPIVATSSYSLREDQKFLESFSLEAKKFKFQEIYKKVDQEDFLYMKRGEEVLLKNIPQNVLDPLGSTWDLVVGCNKETVNFDGAEAKLLVGGKVKTLCLKRSGAGYLVYIKGKKIIGVQRVEKGALVQILSLPFKPEIRVQF